MTNWTNRLSPRTKIGLGTAALLALGAAGGAGAVAVTRPAIEMAPITPIAIGTLARHSGIVTVKGRIAEVYGNRFIVGDASGRTMVDAGRFAEAGMQAGAPVTVQGRYLDGQLHASFLVDQAGTVEQVGPAHRLHGHPGGPDGPCRDHDRGREDGPDRAMTPPLPAAGAPVPIAAGQAPVAPAPGR